MARLTYRERKKMPRKEFALPGRRDKGHGGFPINDKRHARNALARASQGVKHGTLSRSEAAEVREKVHRKFPSIGQRKLKRGTRSMRRR